MDKFICVSGGGCSSLGKIGAGASFLGALFRANSVSTGQNSGFSRGSGAGFRVFGPLLIAMALAACSFDYGNQESADKDLPDIVMENVDYTRMRSGDPVARLFAEQALRYEERRIMELYTLSFEQFEKSNGDVNAFGFAGSAEFMLDSGDVRMDNGVRIDVESEDIIIETKQLEWKDEAHLLTGGESEFVRILRANGTSFSGIGFIADARRRTWEFARETSGSYIHDDDDAETKQKP